MSKRFCFHADESYQDRDTGSFNLIRVEEDEPGYTIVSWGFSTVQGAKSEADRKNAKLGLTEKDVLDIRVSSMTAGRR